MATLENLNFTFLQNIFHQIVLTGFGFPFWHMKWTTLKTRKGLPYLFWTKFTKIVQCVSLMLSIVQRNDVPDVAKKSIILPVFGPYTATSG